jgi:hypothetical protein
MRRNRFAEAMPLNPSRARPSLEGFVASDRFWSFRSAVAPTWVYSMAMAASIIKVVKNLKVPK